MDIRHIYIFIGISILSCISCKNSTKEMIKIIGFDLPGFPKGYIAPAKLISRIFNIKQYLIPKYFYLELILSIVFAILGPVNLLIFILTGCNSLVFRILVMIHTCMILSNMIVFGVLSIYFKKKSRKRK